jgi:hypothetical protein
MTKTFLVKVEHPTLTDTELYDLLNDAGIVVVAVENLSNTFDWD